MFKIRIMIVLLIFPVLETYVYSSDVGDSLKKVESYSGVKRKLEETEEEEKETESNKKKQKVEKSKEKNTICSVCKKGFKFKSQLETHLAAADKAGFEAECDDCHHRFRDDHAMRVHRNQVHPEAKPLVKVQSKIEKSICSGCKKEFINKLLLHIHLQSVDKEGFEVKCDRCPHLFRSILAMKTHRNYGHPEVKPLVKSEQVNCEVCEKSFKDKPKLERHLTAVDQEGFEASCDVCPHLFGSISAMKSHRSSLHPEAEPLVKVQSKKEKSICPVCEHVFGDKPGLKAHLSKVDQEGFEASCDVCPHLFGSISAMKIHRSSLHPDAKPLESKNIICPVCERHYKSESDLNSHLRAVDQKGYKAKCDDCRHRFKDNGRLKFHRVQIHLEPKPLESKNISCPVCERHYKSESDLNSHLRAVDQKGYKAKCDDCRHRFKDNGRLKFHRVQIHLKPKLLDKGQLDHGNKRKFEVAIHDDAEDIASDQEIDESMIDDEEEQKRTSPLQPKKKQKIESSDSAKDTLLLILIKMKTKTMG